MNVDQELYGHVETAIRTVLSVDGSALSPTTSLGQDLGAESIDFLDICCEIEKLLDLEVNFRELMKGLRARTGALTPDVTVEDIVDFVRLRRIPRAD